MKHKRSSLSTERSYSVNFDVGTLKTGCEKREGGKQIHLSRIKDLAEGVSRSVCD